MPRPRPVNEKKCPMCKKIKNLDEFYSSEKYDGGFSTYCKTCIAIKNKEHRNKKRDSQYKKKYYDKDPEKFKEISRNNQKKMKTERPAFYRAKKFFDVKRDNVDSNITREVIEQLFINTEFCECCGKKLDLHYQERSDRKYRSNPNSPSIDRINNHKGYSLDNIAVICWECNYRKTDLCEEDLIMFLKYIRREKTCAKTAND